MLTNKSVFYDDNQKLNENEIYHIAEKVILPDCINCGMDNVGAGFPPAAANIITNYIDGNKKYLILNDLTLNMTNALIEKGVDIKNIYLVFSYFYKDTKNKIVIDDNKLYNIMKKYLLIAYKEEFNCISFEEAKNMDFEYIIGNPPYGKSGSLAAKITKNIIANLDYKEFINLAPSSTYINNDKTLYKYVRCLSDKINGVFESATTDPCIAIIDKNFNNKYSSVQDFEINNIFNSKFRKYFNENIKRVSVIEQHLCNKGAAQVSTKFKSNNSFITGIFVTADGVHNLTDTHSIGEKYWNIDLVDKNVDEVFKSTRGKEKGITITVFKGKTLEEQTIKKINFSKWFYSAELSGKNCKDGLATKLLWAMNTSTSRPYSVMIPNVDWTRSWTDEEILKDYGYTDDEIKEIL